MTTEEKARTHRVEPMADGSAFAVTSGTSRARYLVRPTRAGAAVCSCPSGQHAEGYREHGRPEPGPCSHVLAVFAFARRILDAASRPGQVVVGFPDMDGKPRPDQVRALHEWSNLTIRNLAERVGVCKQTWIAWSKGTPMRARHAARFWSLAEVLRLDDRLRVLPPPPDTKSPRLAQAFDRVARRAATRAARKLQADPVK